MTKEELKQEAEGWLNKWELCNKCDHKVQCIEDNAMCPQVVEQAYLASAEPREKRIAELIALINAERKRQEKCDDVHLRKIAELEKENAELKERIKTLEQIKQEHIDYTIKVEEERTFVKDQLTKAKGLLKRCYDNYIYLQPLRNDIEQFLNGEVEK